MDCAQLGRMDEHAPQALREPSLAPLHSDPRFAEVKRKFGLA
jgi:hypothetical protein